jgi:hypothetical protein
MTSFATTIRAGPDPGHNRPLQHYGNHIMANKLRDLFNQHLVHHPDVLPKVLAHLELARERGDKHISVASAFDEIRKRSYKRTGLDNRMTSLYSRLVAELRPELAPHLRMRQLKNK